MNIFQQFKKASRMSVIMVILIPIALGAAGAYAWTGEIRWIPLLLSLIGGGAVHLFSNMINDLWDFKNGADGAAKETEGAISTNSGYLTNGVWSYRQFAAVTWTLFGIAAVCGIALVFMSGPLVWLFAGLGALIAYFYVAPPLKLGYRGKGYSEIAILIAFGFLPVAGSYYVQTSEIDYRAVLLSLPIGLLTTLILFNHHFLHWKADRAAGKRTLVVVWGERRALQFSRLLLLIAYICLIVCVLAGALPLYALLGLLMIIPIYAVYNKLGATNESVKYLPLMGAAVKSSTRCGLLMVAALLVQGLTEWL
ncbi:prenyltransferase [Paenibacillus protaetiae]|uniref:Prenyltransferase n=1 Tax=Paenibacillus protaetiae TaxID=2509456 RepID=A0A4P6ESJ9_9BACL|nr:prenyltransferase [Paenibacillus protaetiae]QAY65395.1 prenyltransferase [Paenibacillus protaetiae]